MSNNLNKNLNINDEDLTVREYWKKYKYDIANIRGWDCTNPSCPMREEKCEKHCPCRKAEDCPTIKNYDNLIDKLDTYLSSSISETTVFEVRDALICMQVEYQYAKTTVKGALACLRDIFKFAKRMGHAENILAIFATGKKMDPAMRRVYKILNSFRPEDNTVSRLEELREEVSDKQRSLTHWQREKLMSMVRKGILSDGRYVGIAVFCYTGVRPAEGRKLLWRDIIPFIDHKDRNYFIIYEIRMDDGSIKEKTKTQNGTRKVSIHFELQMLLSKRLELVRKERPKDYLDCPVCCMGNDFSRPCKDFQLASFADDLFDTIKITKSDLVSYYIDAALESKKAENKKTRDGIFDGEAISLYVLRKNFWTWMEAETQLSDAEKRNVMGHQILDENGRDIRGEFNDENMLWNICAKMDAFVFCKELHKELLERRLSLGGSIQVSNVGTISIVIPPEILISGGVIQIECLSEEVNDPIIYGVSGAVSPLKKAHFSTKSFPAGSVCRTGINCQYENVLAHTKPTPPKKEEEST